MVLFSTVAWHRLVAKTQQSRTALFTFVGACLAVPFVMAEVIQGATNSQGQEAALRKELQAQGTMDGRIYTREQRQRLQSFFDEIKSPEKSEAAYKAALEGNTLVGSTSDEPPKLIRGRPQQR